MLTTFCVDFLPDLDSQVTTSQHLLQAGVLCLQRFEPLDLVGVVLAKLLASHVNGGISNKQVSGLRHPTYSHCINSVELSFRLEAITRPFAYR